MYASIVFPCALYLHSLYPFTARNHPRDRLNEGTRGVLTFRQTGKMVARIVRDTSQVIRQPENKYN